MELAVAERTQRPDVTVGNPVRSPPWDAIGLDA
jgi:hypothetical protein